ncbi:pyridoxamine 5'-phosphate oxidase [Nakamurella leprariae]|uniref:Pyridoxine/pyridoxamine 5'-phosphate oxidase n=1 Tax=Nakamurella leprariae TaxID=2803911 RepID=A0A938Y9F3_9ACTN|nr:pyridoxamine 5'-phosphate oxidase [Nakamurella leprariae]MBM9466382.1 pyridoxamine 5'-phosphate oxidase [Nakamurella leprariae]
MSTEQDQTGPDLAQMRQSYERAGLTETDLEPDWPAQFRRWMQDAVRGGLREPNAMVVATASADGTVSSRSVLAKGYDARGVVFYTNYESAKSRDLAVNPSVSATFPWYELQRQIHVRGRAERVDASETEAYWAQRPRGSQIGAWASPQSRPLTDRAALDALQLQVEARFGAADDEQAPAVPVPPFWGGWRIVPTLVEFWQGRRGRMHDRLVFVRDAGSDVLDPAAWTVQRLAP